MGRHSFHFGRTRGHASGFERDAESHGADRASDRACAIVIRVAGAGDTAELERLAVLDSKPLPRGLLLVAEVDGRIVAALAPWMWRERLADPFLATVELLEVLEQRAGQLRAASGRRRRRRGIARSVSATQ
jgi:hypothetical protein